VTTSQTDLQAAYEVCRRVTFTHAKTFYFASHFIPRSKRAACYAVYAFCRYVDDIVDVAMEQGDVTRDDAIRLVEQWRSDVGSLYEQDGSPDADHAASQRTPESSAVLLAWEDTLTRYHIPRHLPEELIEGVLMDTTISRFNTYDELREYCYKVASVVGLMTSEIFGFTDQRAVPHAIDLGIAMQLTNIIRDIKEDTKRDRIYLPREEYERFGVTEQEILDGVWSSRMHDLIRFQVERADALYDSADIGIPYLDVDSRLTVQLMSTNYRKILRVVEGMDHNVFRGRASTSTLQKILSIPVAWWHVKGMKRHS